MDQEYVSAKFPTLFSQVFPKNMPLRKGRYLIILEDGKMEVDYWYASEKRWHKHEGKVAAYYEPARSELKL
jgi:hypothetical protein